jgi:hypothetical protein
MAVILLVQMVILGVVISLSIIVNFNHFPLKLGILLIYSIILRKKN